MAGRQRQAIHASRRPPGLVCAASVLAIAGMVKLHARSAPVPDVMVAGTAGQILRGQAIANSFCGACHERNGPLIGGRDVANDLSIPVGSFMTANLTPAGELSLEGHLPAQPQALHHKTDRHADRASLLQCIGELGFAQPQAAQLICARPSIARCTVSSLSRAE